MREELFGKFAKLLSNLSAASRHIGSGVRWPFRTLDLAIVTFCCMTDTADVADDLLAAARETDENPADHALAWSDFLRLFPQEIAKAKWSTEQREALELLHLVLTNKVAKLDWSASAEARSVFDKAPGLLDCGLATVNYDIARIRYPWIFKSKNKKSSVAKKAKFDGKYTASPRQVIDWFKKNLGYAPTSRMISGLIRRGVLPEACRGPRSPGGLSSYDLAAIAAVPDLAEKVGELWLWSKHKISSRPALPAAPASRPSAPPVPVAQKVVDVSAFWAAYPGLAAEVMATGNLEVMSKFNEAIAALQAVKGGVR